MKLTIGPVFSEFESDERYVLDLVKDASRFRPKGFQFRDAFKNGTWDGWEKLYQELEEGRSGYRFPTGFVPHLIISLEEDGVLFEIEDQRIRPEPQVNPLVGDLEGIRLRDYQEQMVDALSSSELKGYSFYILGEEMSEFLYSGVGRKTPYRIPGIGIWWSATGSGKTECAASLIGRLGVKTLFLVYGKSLVKQTFDRFNLRLGRWLFNNGLELGFVSEGVFNLQFITVASSSSVSAALRGPKLTQKRGLHILDLLSGERSSDDKVLVKEALRSVTLKKGITGKLPRLFAKIAILQERGEESLETLHKCLLPEDVFTEKDVLLDEQLEQYQDWLKSYRLAIARHSMVRQHKLLEQLKTFPFFERISKWYQSWIASLFTYPERLEAAKIRKQTMLEYLGDVKLLILDEAHGGASDSIIEIMRACPAYYKCGMSGTPLDRSERDNLKSIGYFGDVICRITNAQMRKAKVIPPATVIITKIGGKLNVPEAAPFTVIEREGIVRYASRNYKVILHTQQAYKAGRPTFILVKLREHGELLSRLLWCEPDEDGDHTFIPHEILKGEPIPHERVDGRDSQEERERVVSLFRAGVIRVVIATGIFRTGLDVPEIEEIIRADAGEGKIPIKQGTGRALRSDKPVIIRDYADGHHRVLAKHSLSRINTFVAEGCFDIKYERE